MRFYNKENENVKLPDGRVVWLSRACVVVVTVWCIIKRRKYLLLGKRGIDCQHEPGKWNLPCGYLDWNETLKEAAIREVYEETGFNITKAIGNPNSIISNNLDHPWKISSRVTGGKKNQQNVTIHFSLVFEAAFLPKLSTQHSCIGEVDEAIWIEKHNINNYQYAFGHKKIINEFLKLSYFTVPKPE